MDIQTLHPGPEVAPELTHLLRLIQDVKAKDFGSLRSRCEFLEREIIFVERTMKNATAVIEGDLGHEDRVRDSVQGCIIVASFIAGVQAQIISFTYQSNNTSLQFTANLFAFVGITLDVLGASNGAVCTILLRRSIERSKLLLMDLNEIRRHIYANTEQFTNPKEQDINKILEDMCLLGSLSHTATQLPAPGALLTQRSTPHPTTISLPIATTLIKGTPIFALISIVAIAIGTLCLLVSVLAFAAISQLRGVWVTCLATGASLPVLLVLRMLNIPGNRREAKYRDLEERLRKAKEKLM